MTPETRKGIDLIKLITTKHEITVFQLEEATARIELLQEMLADAIRERDEARAVVAELRKPNPEPA